MAIGRFAPSSATVQKSATGPGVTGRPKKIQPIFLPVPGASDFQYDPVVMQTAKDMIKKHEMPPGLQPRRVRALQNLTNQKISRGFVPKIGK